MNTKNEELGRMVLSEIVGYLNNNDSSFKMLTDGDRDLGVGLLEDRVEVRINESYKVRIHTGNLIGYGYDFTKRDDDGRPAQKIYERAVENTAKLRGQRGFETLVESGVIEKRFVWYLTGVFLRTQAEADQTE